MGGGLSVSHVRKPWEFPNQLPININASVAATTAFNIIPFSSPGLRIYLFDFSLDIDGSLAGGVVVKLQEFNGSVATDICTLRQGQAGSPVNMYLPTGHYVHFSGAALDPENGLQLLNTAANTIGIFGTLTYSKDI